MSSLQRGLDAFRLRLDGPQEWKAADRALTLHMLRGLAPAFFAANGLQTEWEQALDRLRSVPARFPPELTLDQAMSRLDALYLRRLHGTEKESSFDRAGLADYITGLREPPALLAAWVMGRQARTLGVEAGPVWEERFPFAEESWQLHLYFVTHLFMLESDYFLRAVEPAHFSQELEQLERGLRPLGQGRRWDLLAEAQLCLASCRRAEPDVDQALRKAQRIDGSWAESGHDIRQAAHTTCSCLVALAAAREIGNV